MGLKFLGQMEEKDQCVGNCTWESSASFAMQGALAILTAEEQDPHLKNLFNSDKTVSDSFKEYYHMAKRVMDNFKSFVAYNTIKKYIDQGIKNLETNKCLPDTGILTEVLRQEIDKAKFTARSALKENYFQQKTLDAILNSGLPLKRFNEKFYPGSSQLDYLLNKFSIHGGTIENKADELYDIYDPRGKRLIGKSSYPWGECFY